MKLLAVLLGAWAALRWTGFAVGWARMRRLDGQVRGEARRSVVVRASLNVFVSVAALYAWSAALRLAPAPGLVGLMALLMVLALVAAVTAGFMQPAERSPESLDLFRLRRRSGAG